MDIPASRQKTTCIRIFLIDNHTLVRAGLRMLLESEPQFHVVGDVCDIAEAQQLVIQHQPDIILFEAADPQLESLNPIPHLLAQAKRARLILITGERNAEFHHHAAQLGAMGVVLKDQSPDTLVKAILKVHAGEAWFDRTTIANVLTKLSRPQPEQSDPEAEKIATLTPREREIINLVGKGLKNQIIAQELALSEITVRHHLTSIYAKLNVSDRLELLIYAYQQGLAQLPDSH